MKESMKMIATRNGANFKKGQIFTLLRANWDKMLFVAMNLEGQIATVEAYDFEPMGDADSGSICLSQSELKVLLAA